MRPDGRPVLCLITDRRRLTGVLGAPQDAWQRLLLVQIEGAIAGGVDVVQIREPDLDAGVLVSVVRECLKAASGTSTRVFVNDRLDVAIAAKADGLHIREDGVSTAATRAFGPRPQLIGRSVHSVAGVRHVGAVDYLIAGSVFETRSKPGAPASLGLDGLRDVVKRAGVCPVWAIGGITSERLPHLSRAGARGAAAIGAFLPSSIAEVAREVQKLTANLRFSFDSSVGLP